MANKFKCVHCSNDMPIPFNKIIEALNKGKSVIECKSCNKLNTIRNDEGEKIYIV